ncbi:MAG: sigma-70 family RNA polymerase sigma factor [Planctomycetes bacterium]|nr:sigma-70 family RNA polymerase sigma factor [Planctomycetota bacterium]
MSHPHDSSFRARLLAGLPDAWEDFVDANAAALLSTARALTNSRVNAEDAVQQTFLNLFRARDSFARAERPRAYAFRVLHRVAGLMRARRAHLEALDEHRAPCAGHDETAEPDSELERALATLSHEQREVVALKIDGELTFAEIAALLAIPADTAASRYRRALERLRERLGGSP